MPVYEAASRVFRQRPFSEDIWGFMITPFLLLYDHHMGRDLVFATALGSSNEAIAKMRESNQKNGRLSRPRRSLNKRAQSAPPRGVGARVIAAAVQSAQMPHVQRGSSMSLAGAQTSAMSRRSGGAASLETSSARQFLTAHL
jgi:hypothetical protein